MPSRFPTGFALNFPRLASNTAAITFTAGDTTPNVSRGSFFLANPASGVTITNFDVGNTLVQGGGLGDLQGQVLYVLSVTGGITTIQDSAGGITTSLSTFSVQAVGSADSVTTGGNILMNGGEVLAFIWHRNTWFQIDNSVRFI